MHVFQASRFNKFDHVTTYKKKKKILDDQQVW